MKFESTQTYILVTLITLLIWLYAESENVVSHTARINVQLVAPEGYAVLDQSRNLPVEIIFQAASSVRDEMMRLNQDNEIKLELNPVVDNPVVQLTIRDELNRLPMFIERGARIETATPAIEQVRVEEMVTREIPVIVNKGQLKLLAEPKVTPEKIKVTMPRSLSEKWKDLEAVASLDQIEGVDQLPAIVPQQGTVPISVTNLVGEPHVTYSNSSVDIDFAIEKVKEKEKEARVKLFLQLSRDAQAKYEITVNLGNNEDFLRDVQYSGPADVVKRVKANKELQAILILTDEELKVAAERQDGKGAKYPKLMPLTVDWDNPTNISYTVRKRR